MGRFFYVNLPDGTINQTTSPCALNGTGCAIAGVRVHPSDSSTVYEISCGC